MSLIELSREVAPVAEILGIRMSLADFSAPTVQGSAEVRYGLDPTWRKCEDGNYLADIGFKLNCVTKEVPQKDTGLKIHAHFEAMFKIEGEFSEESIGAFLRLNAVYVSWSYIREYVQDCTSRMRIQTIVLPLMTANSLDQLLKDSTDDCGGAEDTSQVPSA